MLTEVDWHQRLSKHAASGEKEHGRIQGVFDLSVRRVLQIELKWQSKKVLCIDYLQISNQCQKSTLNSYKYGISAIVLKLDWMATCSKVHRDQIASMVIDGTVGLIS